MPEKILLENFNRDVKSFQQNRNIRDVVETEDDLCTVRIDKIVKKSKLFD